MKGPLFRIFMKFSQNQGGGGSTPSKIQGGGGVATNMCGVEGQRRT